MVRFDKFTLKAQEAVQSAQDIAARHDHQQIEPLHLLGALVAQKDGSCLLCLERLGVRPDTLASEIESRLGRIPKVTGVGAAADEPGGEQSARRGIRRSGAIQGTKMFPPSTSCWRSPRFARMRPRNFWPKYGASREAIL